jgi:hypothetical protein
MVDPSGDDEHDHRDALPSWVPQAERHDTERPLRGRARTLALGMIGLGGTAVAVGLLLPESTTEVVLGSAIALLGVRALTGSQSAGADE